MGRRDRDWDNRERSPRNRDRGSRDWDRDWERNRDRDRNRDRRRRRRSPSSRSRSRSRSRSPSRSRSRSRSPRARDDRYHGDRHNERRDNSKHRSSRHRPSRSRTPPVPLSATDNGDESNNGKSSSSTLSAAASSSHASSAAGSLEPSKVPQQSPQLPSLTEIMKMNPGLSLQECMVKMTMIQNMGTVMSGNLGSGGTLPGSGTLPFGGTQLGSMPPPAAVALNAAMSGSAPNPLMQMLQQTGGLSAEASMLQPAVGSSMLGDPAGLLGIGGGLHSVDLYVANLPAGTTAPQLRTFLDAAIQTLEIGTKGGHSKKRSSKSRKRSRSSKSSKSWDNDDNAAYKSIILSVAVAVESSPSAAIAAAVAAVESGKKAPEPKLLTTAFLEVRTEADAEDLLDPKNGLVGIIMDDHLLNFGRPSVAPTAAEAALAGALNINNMSSTQQQPPAISTSTSIATTNSGNSSDEVAPDASTGAEAATGALSMGGAVADQSSSQQPEVLSLTDVANRGPPTAGLPPGLAALQQLGVAVPPPVTLLPAAISQPAAPPLHNGVLSTVLMCMNVPEFLEEDALRKLVEPFGDVSAFKLVRDVRTGKSKGSFVFEYENAEEVTEGALHFLNGLSLGQEIRLSVQRVRPEMARALLMRKGDNGTNSDNPTAAVEGAEALPSALSASSEGVTPSECLILDGMVTAEELADAAEVKDIIDDVKSESAKYGPVVEVRVPTLGQPGAGSIFLRFGAAADGAVSAEIVARKAREDLHGRDFGDEGEVKAAFFPLDRFLAGELGPPKFQASPTESQSIQSQPQTLPSVSSMDSTGTAANNIPPWQKEEQQEQGEQDDNNEDAEEVSSAPAATSVVDMPAITADDLD